MQIVAVTDPLQLGLHPAGDDRHPGRGRPRAGRRRARRHGRGRLRRASPPGRSTCWPRWSARTTTTCSSAQRAASAAIPGVRTTETFVYLEAAQADLHLGNPMTDSDRLTSRTARPTAADARTRPPLDALHPACRPTTTAPTCPIIVRGEGAYICDANGKRYLDGAGRAVRRPGRPRPRRARRGRAPSRPQSSPSSRSGPTPTRRPSSSPTGSPSYAPGDLNRVFFTTGGGEAVETAWKLAKQYFKLTGKPTKHKVISRAIAYHGTTAGRAVDHRPARRSSTTFEPLVPGDVPGAEHQLLPRAASTSADDRRGVRPLGRRPDRGGDRVRGPGHRRRGLPRAGAERRRLLPAAARLLRAGPRDLRRVRRAAGLRRGDLRLRPARAHVRRADATATSPTSSPAPRASPPATPRSAR